ncbi:sulfate transporter family protein [Bartonella tamiae]|uniref:CysZ-like protein n=1 Tax=Bartonella tamiae Th239 TaxID=1094558 RepID=J0R642_9HYPH|nr:sulfate transporter family protein [Bartonella tamiae]EJF91169.1 hypothetical protein ME5_00501 [Bartonella tamiae Th239]EJF93166.1 hypothetical protein MEG_01380 [Bartonella tamiae Th307]
MIFDAAYRALQRIFTPPFRSMLWKALGATLAILAILWLLVRQAFFTFVWPWIADFLPTLPSWVGWLGFIGALTFSIGLAVLMALLIAPITAMIGGFFIDDVAEIIEKNDYRNDIPGTAMPLGRSLIIALRFVLLSILGNFIALLLFFVPGVNLIAFYVINGYLFGREYFEFAACRFRSEADAHAFYKRNSGSVFISGLIIAFFVSIPFLNLLTPLFAAAFMIHLYKKLDHNDEKKTLINSNHL